MLHPVARAVRDHVDEATVLAAVSGGADSMAMLDALCALAAERPRLRVVAAHFDHRLREDSVRDRDTVAAFAAARGVAFVSGAGDVRARARSARESLETAARAMRYAFLERAAAEHGADVIATAHTRSDQVETVLMRILRGTGARGLAGIPARRGRIVRPLLSVARGDTHDYCAAHGVPFLADPSNEDRRHARNRVRHDVLPALRSVYPGLDSALERIGANARAACDRADERVRDLVTTHLRADGDAFVLDAAAFADLDDDERQHLLSRALDAMDAHRDVSRVHYRALLSLARDTARTGAAVDLPRLRARREHDGLVFAPRPEGTGAEAPAPLVLNVPGAVVIGGWKIDAWWTGAGPIVVRFPRPGDRMRPFGMAGTKKLSDLFIDAKIPQRQRARTPVVEMGGEIVWVAGVAAGEATRVSHEHEPRVRLAATRVEGA